MTLAMEWSSAHDEALLQEVIVAEPFRFRPSTRERGHAWEVVAGRLNSHQQLTFHVRQRSVRDRFNLLEKKFKRKMREEEGASGISPERSQFDELLEEVIDKFKEADIEASNEKAHSRDRAEIDREQAEEMRQRSMEKLGETNKRKADSGWEVSPRRKRSNGSDTINYLRERTEREVEIRREEMELRQAEQEEIMKIRREELEIKRKEQEEQQKNRDESRRNYQMLQQQQLQMMHLLQKQQQQQQQQQTQQMQALMALVEKMSK